MGFVDAQQAVYFPSGYRSNRWCYDDAATAGKPQAFVIVRRKCKKPSQIRYNFRYFNYNSLFSILFFYIIRS